MLFGQLAWRVWGPNLLAEARSSSRFYSSQHQIKDDGVRLLLLELKVQDVRDLRQERDMRYSLVSRFQGALVGTVLGERARAGGDRPLKGEQRSGLQAQPEPISAIADRLTRGAQALVEGRTVIPDVWRSLLAEPLPGENEPPSAALAIALALPVFLVFHGSPYERTSALEAIAAARPDPEFLAGATVWLEAIALGLTERLEPSTLLAHGLEALPDSPDSASLAPLRQALNQAQICLSTQKPLNQTERALTALNLGPTDGTAKAIALAAAHFLSAPDNPALLLGRLQPPTADPRAVGALAGGLSGLYNGLSGLPILSRLALAASPSGPTDQLSTLKTAGAALAGVWSGAMDPTEFAAAGQSGLAIAAARVIRPR